MKTNKRLYCTCICIYFRKSIWVYQKPFVLLNRPHPPASNLPVNLAHHLTLLFHYPSSPLHTICMQVTILIFSLQKYVCSKMGFLKAAKYLIKDLLVQTLFQLLLRIWCISFLYFVNMKLLFYSIIIILHKVISCIYIYYFKYFYTNLNCLTIKNSVNV